MTLTTIDHVQAALDRLPRRLQTKQRWTELLAALVRPFQALEDALIAMYDQRHLDNAEGAQLDQLGALVGEPRAGRTDDAYRRRIRARVAHNRSHGLTEDLIRITRLVAYDDAVTVACEQQDVATEVVRLGGAAVTTETAEELISFLRTGVAAGVRAIVEYSPAAPAATFTFDTGGLGFPTPYMLALANHTSTGFDTVIGVRDSAIAFDESSATSFTLAFIADAGAPDAGAWVDTWPDLSFTFKPSTTTMRNFEGAIATSSWIRVVTKSTTTGALEVADAFGPLAFNNWDAAADGGALAGALE